jgi:hypothetical protein
MKRKRSEFSLNVGTSSILLIFVMLCLVSFAILSLSSGLSDLSLSKRVISNTESYYNACAQAEEQLEDIELTLQSLYDTGISRAGYFDKVGKKMSFSIPVSDIQVLSVSIDINYPDEAKNTFYDITEFRIETVGNLEYDESLHVFR